MTRDEYVHIFSILSKRQTHMAECVKITRRDGTIFRFTSHDEDLTIREPDGFYYKYLRANSFVMTSLETDNGLAVSNMDIDGMIDDNSITEDDLRNGLFDNARLDVFLAYWMDRSVKVLPLRVSWIGEIQTEDTKFKVDLRGIASRLAQTFVQVTSLECRWRFTDDRCGLTPAAFERTVAISEVPTDDTFLANIPEAEWENKYQWGIATILSGENEGAQMEILRQFGTRVQLFLPLAKPLVPGTAVSIRQGCNKKFSTCCTRFTNSRRFGGEPFLAGADMITRYAVRESSEI